MSTEYRVYLPVHANDGSPFDAESVAELHAMLARRFGGYTAYQTLGCWLNDGVRYQEPITVMSIITDDSDATAWLQRYAALVKVTLAQQSVLFSIHHAESHYV